jgi:hypothetical protein
VRGPQPAKPEPKPADGPVTGGDRDADAIVDQTDVIELGDEDEDVWGAMTGTEVEEPVADPEPEPIPEPEPNLAVEADMEPMRRSRRQPIRRLFNAIGSRVRNRRGIKTKSAQSRRRQVNMMSADENARERPTSDTAADEAAFRGDDGVSVYEFADDEIDASRTMPQGAQQPPATTPTTTTIDLPPEEAVSFERLKTPEVTASALSVVIPTTGLVVRYEQLLIDANQTQTVTIDARRRLRR